jgi:hypothetical protein
MGVRSGRFSASIGVGTATMMKVRSESELPSLSKRAPLALSSSLVTSPVSSWPDRSAAMRFVLISKPIVSNFLAMATATGSPT